MYSFRITTDIRELTLSKRRVLGFGFLEVISITAGHEIVFGNYSATAFRVYAFRLTDIPRP